MCGSVGTVRTQTTPTAIFFCVLKESAVNAGTIHSSISLPPEKVKLVFEKCIKG